MESLRLAHGSARERGRHHGEHWRASIAEAVDARPAAADADASFAALAEHAPLLCEELLGIAEGANVAGAGLLALDDGEAEQSLVYFLGDDGPLLGQTWWTGADPRWIEHAALGSAPACVVLTGSGVLAWTGINSQGLAVGVARLPGLARRAGLPVGAVVRRLLMESTAAAARRALQPLPLAAGCFVVLADGTDYRGIECSPTDRVDTQSGPRAAHVHTNHCFDPVLRRGEQVPATSTSFARLNEVSTLYAQQRPRTSEALWDLLRAEAGAGAHSVIAPTHRRVAARPGDAPPEERTVPPEPGAKLG